MPESAEEYYARVRAATDDEGRLHTLSEHAVSEWDIFPYETDRLRVRPLQPLLDAEPPRYGEDPAACHCALEDRSAPRPGEVWRDQRWFLRAETPTPLPVYLMLSPFEHTDLADLDEAMAAELGRITVAVAAAVEQLPSVGRAHVNKWGDGGAHLHLQILGRPARMGQLRGSCLPDWMEHLPPIPEDVARENLRFVVDRLVSTYGGAAVSAARPAAGDAPVSAAGDGAGDG